MTNLDFSLLLTDVPDEYLLDVEAFLAKQRAKKPRFGGRRHISVLIAAVLVLLGGLITALAVNREFRETVASWVGISSAEIEQAEPPAQEQPEPVPIFEIPAAPWLTDEYAAQQIIATAEKALPDDSFQFSNPSELSSEQLLMLYLMLTPWDELQTHRSALDAFYYYTDSDIRATLDQYFEDYIFDITQCSAYDAQSGMARFNVPAGDSSAGFGNYLEPRIEEKSSEGNTATYTVGFYRTLYQDGEASSECYRKKVYTIEFYDGGWFYRSAKTVFFLPHAVMEEVPLPDFDPKAPIKDEEFVLCNGVRLGMRYDEVIETLGGVVTPAVSEEEHPYFWHDGTVYFFSLAEDGEYRLVSLQIAGAQSGVYTLRGIRIGMDIADVFALIPAQDTELKRWAEQEIYRDGEYHAWLEFVANSFYSLRIQAQTQIADITFSRVGTQVKYIDLTYLD